MKHIGKIGTVAIAILLVVAAAVSVRMRSQRPDTLQTEPSELHKTEPSQTKNTQQSIQTEPSRTEQPGQTQTPIPPQTTAPTEPATEPTWMTVPGDRELSALEYFVYDCDTGEFLAISGDPDTQVEPASITKLFTAYVAMQYLEPQSVVTCGDALQLVVPGSSVAQLEPECQLTVEQLVEAMLLPSGNDAAYVLAVQAGRIIDGKPNEYASVAAKSFVAEMNRQAQMLGMMGTHYANPDGIHRDSHYSTLRDLALLGALSMENDTILKYAAVVGETVMLPSGQELCWENTNALIDPESEYYCPYAVGLKTGQTPYAGSCLLSGFRFEGRSIVIGVFGCKVTQDRFVDTIQLFNEIMGFADPQAGSCQISGE